MSGYAVAQVSVELPPNAAARLRNQCRRQGIQIGTINALLAQLSIGHKLAMLSTDRDFSLIADCTELRLWRAP